MAAVEFALLAPIILLFMGGVIDYGYQIYCLTQLQSAVRAAGQYASGTGRATDVGTISTILQSATGLDGITLQDARSYCMCAEGGAETSCTGSPCGAGSAVGAYLEISATYTFTPMTGIFFSEPKVLSYSLTVRTS